MTYPWPQAEISDADRKIISEMNWSILTIDQALAFVGGWNAGTDTATMAKAFNVPPASLRMSLGSLNKNGVSVRRAAERNGRPIRKGPLAHEILGDLKEFPGGASIDDLFDWLGVPEDRIVRAVRLLFEAGDVVIAPRPKALPHVLSSAVT